MCDAYIIALYNERSEAAIAETKNKYGAFCFKIAFNILRSPEDSEECVSDAYLSVWNAIPPQNPACFSAFLGRIVRNQALKKQEYHQAGKRSANLTVALQELEECVSDETDSVEAEHDYAELGRAIGAFLESADPVSRIVFMRRYWFMESIQEIAGLSGLRESKVKNLLFKTRSGLKKHLQKEGFGL